MKDMPKELKKRGRRAAKQNNEPDAHDGPPTKKRRTEESQPGFAVIGDAGDDLITFGQDHENGDQDAQQTTFYGLLTEEEQEYYANVNNKIGANDFENEEDKANFIDAVHRESSGKEIKVASSQSSSRYLETIIRLSTANQLRSLFLAFLQDLDYLVQHRFGSHCCETLFLESAKHVDVKSKSTEDSSTSFENLFLEAAAKLQANIGFLLTERFASHTVRVLLLVLSGQPLQDTAAKETVGSRKKEKPGHSQHPESNSTDVRKVPHSFKKARRDLMVVAVSGLDTNYLRALATSPTGNPVLQLLLRIELSEGAEEGQNSHVVLQKLVPDQNFEPESDSSKFVSSLVYDSTGAYLVQALVRSLPGKSFKKMYRNLFRDRIGKLAKNEIASYVAISIFERVGKDDLAHAVEALVPEIPGLVERNRLAVVRTLVERSAVRGVDLLPISEVLIQTYDSDPKLRLQKMLKLEGLAPSAAENSDEKGKEKLPVDLQGSLLAQSMLRTSQLCELVQDSLLAQSDSMLLQLAESPVASRIIQVALTSEKSSGKFLRRFVPAFDNMISDLAIDVAGSHVVDALWNATNGSHFMKERIAKALQSSEAKLRDSMYGRTVWKNWHMDLYQRKHREWQAVAKGFDQEPTQEHDSRPRKSPIELARERYMQKQPKKNQQHGTGANTVKTNA